MDGIGPNELNIQPLIDKVFNTLKEIIFALSPTMEGDTTNFIYSKTKGFSTLITTLSRGVSVGSSFITDEMSTQLHKDKNTIKNEKTNCTSFSVYCDVLYVQSIFKNTATATTNQILLTTYIPWIAQS